MNPLKSIKLDLIEHAPFNPRKLRPDDPKTAELAESIKAVGLLQPIIVRPLDGKYQVLAGARRFEATKLAGEKAISAFITDLDDDKALEITITENLQRSDLTPLEEGRGIASLFKSGRTTDEIAQSIGKSETWVRRRSKIAELCPQWQEAIETNESLAYLTAAHLELIGHLPESIQLELLPMCMTWSRMTLFDLRKQVQRLTQLIRTAPFAEQCALCPYRTDSDVELFSDDAKAKDDARCLDRNCWEQKLEAFVTSRKQAIKKQFKRTPVEISTDYRVKDTLHQYDVSIVEEQTPGAIPAILIDGTEAGELIWIEDPKKAKPAQEDDEKEPEATEQQKLIYSMQVAYDAWLAKQETAPTALQQPIYMLAAVSLFGCRPANNVREFTAEQFLEMSGGEDIKMANAMWESLKRDMVINPWDPAHVDEDDERQLRLHLEVCGLDYGDFAEQAVKS